MTKLYLVLLGAALVFSSCSKSRGPETGDKEVRQAIALYERDQVIDALALFQSAAAKPLQVYDSWEVHNYIGICFLDLRKYEKALAAYNEALDRNPENHIVWVNKGVALRQMDRTDEAEECYRKALAIKPDYAELHASLGSLQIVRNNPTEAVQCLKKAIELDPRLAVAHSNYALALGMLGDFSTAEKELKKAAQLGYANVEPLREHLETMRSNQDAESSRQQSPAGDGLKAAPEE